MACVWARRILLELSPASDEPVWTYFDSQHKHILDRMTSVYQAAIVEVKGKRVVFKHLCEHSNLFFFASAAKERTAPDLPNPDSLSILISAQLATCINAMDINQGEIVIGNSLLTPPSSSPR